LVYIDEMNRRILRLLVADGKMTYIEVAERMRRSPSTIRDRIRRLEQEKAIIGYVAIVNAERLGMTVEGILLANLEEGVSADKLKGLAKMPGVLEVLQVSGRRRILVRLSAPDNHALEETIERDLVPYGLKDIELRIVLERVMRFPGV
jgi:DNA-binding Lrp family transcriptional regulator